MDAILFYLLFFLTQLVSTALAIVLTNIDSIAKNGEIAILSPDPIPAGVSLLVCESLLCAGLWLFFRNRKRRLYTKRATWGNTCTGVAATMLLSLGLSALLEPLHLPDGGVTARFETMCHNPLCLLSLCVVGPLCEEMAFRLGIVESLATRGMSGFCAATVGAAAFALIHGNLAQGIPAFVIGVTLGLMYLHTHSLRLCLPAHVANNTIGVLSLSFPQIAIATSSWPPAAALALGTATLAAGFFLLRLALK